MRKLIWYRHKRFDGGIRTAVDADDNLLLHQFEDRAKEPDPALLWYADLRCEGRRLPMTAEEARQWLLKHSEVIRRGFLSMAEELRAGTDIDSWPVHRSVLGFSPGVKAKIYFSAVRRLEAIEMAGILTDIAEHWDERIRSLPAFAPARASG